MTFVELLYCCDIQRRRFSPGSCVRTRPLLRLIHCRVHPISGPDHVLGRRLRPAAIYQPKIHPNAIAITGRGYALTDPLAGFGGGGLRIELGIREREMR